MLIRVALAAKIVDRSDTPDIRADLARDPIAEKVLTDQPLRPAPDVRGILDSLAGLSPPLKGRAAIWFAQNTQVDEDLANAVYQAIVLDGPAALGSEILDYVLLQVPRVAGHLTESQALQLFRVLWPIASARHDPYNPAAKKPSAAAALVRLVARRPEVEKKLADLVSELSGYQRSEALDLLARSARSRGQTAPGVLVHLAKSLPMSTDELTRFAEIAEPSQRISRRVGAAKANRGERRGVRFAYKLVGYLLAVLPPPLLTVLVFRFDPDPPRYLRNFVIADVKVEAALALVALIATINVFTVQLSTQRLPGAVARAAAQQGTLNGAYVAAITLLISTLYTPSPMPGLWEILQSSLALLSAFWLAIALMRIFKKTDDGEACRAFVDQNISRWARTGRRFGRAQAQAVQLQRAVESLPFVRFTMAATIGHDVVSLRSRSRGVSLPSRRAAKRAMMDASLANGGYVHIPNSFGLVLAAEETVVSIRPPSDAAVSPELQRRLARMFRPRSAKAFEDVSTQTVTLISLALTKSRNGETRLGEAVAEQSARIINSHLAGAQASRRQAQEEFARSSGAQMDSENKQSYPVNPMLRDAIRVLVSGTRSLSSGEERAAEVVLSACLTASRSADHAPLMIANAFDVKSNTFRPELVATWLRSAGLRSIELGQEHAFELIVQKIASLIDEPGYQLHAPRSLASLGSACARLETRWFAVVWQKVSDLAPSMSSIEVTRIMMQLGAASLESGAFVAALKCARLICYDGNLAQLETLTSLDNVFTEASIASLWSVYLGPVPTDSLEHFRDFAKAL